MISLYILLYFCTSLITVSTFAMMEKALKVKELIYIMFFMLAWPLMFSIYVALFVTYILDEKGQEYIWKAFNYKE